MYSDENCHVLMKTIVRSSLLINYGFLFVTSYRLHYSNHISLVLHCSSMGKKGNLKISDPYIETEYSVFEGIRSVIPYVHEFTTHAKGRWIGREIIEVLTREFGKRT
jgi:hypothetical protein